MGTRTQSSRAGGARQTTAKWGDDRSTIRQQIVMEAARLFRNHGFAVVSMRDIGDAVGLSKAGLYHHCPSKEGLLEDIARLGNSLLLQQLQHVREAEGSPGERLRLFMRTRMEVLADFQDVMTVIWQERPRIAADVFEESTRMAETYREGVRELIHDAQRAGVVRPDLDAHLLMLAVDGMTGWSCYWYHREGQLGAGRIGEDFWSFLIDGIGPQVASAISGDESGT